MFIFCFSRQEGFLVADDFLMIIKSLMRVCFLSGYQVALTWLKSHGEHFTLCIELSGPSLVSFIAGVNYFLGDFKIWQRLV